MKRFDYFEITTLQMLQFNNVIIIPILSRTVRNESHVSCGTSNLVFRINQYKFIYYTTQETRNVFFEL